MSETMTEAEFRTWEAQQPLAFKLVNGRPARLPDDHQGPSRLARLRQLARKVLSDEAALEAWISTPQIELGGLEPEALAVDGEEGCQLVLRELVRMGRLIEASHD
jgi:uncharacterized protein (DUF2384 family)